MPTLVVNTGPSAGERFELLTETVIGRQNSDVIISDELLSRRHAVIRPTQGGWEIEDLASLNGTWLNDDRLEGIRPLQPGDLIRMGRTEMAVEAHAADDYRTVLREGPGDITIIRHEAPLERGEIRGTSDTPVEHRVATSKAPQRAPSSAAVAQPSSPELRVPTEPFGHYLAATRGRSVASRRLTPMVFSVVIIVATAVALVLYFWLR